MIESESQSQICRAAEPLLLEPSLLYSLVTYIFIFVTEDASSTYMHRNLNTSHAVTPNTSEIQNQEVSLARIRRNEQIKHLSWFRNKKLRRFAKTLNILDETEDIWLRRSPEEHAVLKEMVS